ncbi:hypothetical protein O6H91_01G098700 [Diphasiastrum complanatum]|uniref:Uncharacterized protein n=2 Tax=Diphasiastrum complanatum TaxID=34168 RepID=A0ACC2ETV0_DIPCM|nr:hypothetical protein O6H91_01G098700 [Diphasiastrum complanatum]KAJ7569884.1 hypothetical protein O6H91_01G098700 [Diphasiastrum complanatum]
MTGQQKRQLELDVSPLPVKCLKHTDISRYKEANDWTKPGTEILKESPDLGSCASTELKQQVSRDESQGHEEAKRALVLASSSVYHEGSCLSKQQELATPERVKVSGSSYPPAYLPTQVRWLPSPSRHILDQSHQTDEHRTSTTPEWSDEVSHPHFSDERFLPRKRVPIGPDFQANVPLWEAKPAPVVMVGIPGGAEGRFESTDENNESRWLGLQVWPLPGCEKIENENKIGKGRTGTCSCIHPCSIECIQKHVQEETMRLKLELGEAFKSWGFSEMGECVSEHWMEEEEQRFKMLVKLNPVSLGRNFWHMLPFAFPSRSTKDFVSYYFNVFVLRRRAIQNRLDPDNIDSDDDECDLTSSDSDDSEGYDTDEEEGEFEQDESDEDKPENDWEQISESETEQGLEASSLLNSKFMNNHRNLSVYDGRCLGDDDMNNASVERVPSTRETTADRDSLDGSMQNSSSIPISEWNCDLQLSGKHFQAGSRSLGTDNLQGDKNWDDHHWMQVNHIPDRELLPKLRSSLDFDVSPYVKESNFNKDHPSLVQRSSLETSGPDLWVGYMDIIPRKSIDKLISTTGLITELFGDGAREADVENKVSGHRLSDFIFNGRRGEME